MSLRASSFSLALFASLVPIATSAQTAPNLFRGSEPTVYLQAADGKRYAFDSEQIFREWYPAATVVQRVADAAVAAIPFGGLIPHRPGATLVKLTTDPKVYVVDSGSTLRWIESEVIAQQLFGMDWAKKILDIPDTAFAALRVGSSIGAGSSFDPTGVAARYVRPDDALVRPAAEPAISAPSMITLTIPPVSPETPVISLLPNLPVSLMQSIATPSARVGVGSKIDLTSSYNGGYGASGTVTSHKIFATAAGMDEPYLIKDCGAVSSCTATFPIYRITNVYNQLTIAEKTTVSAPLTITSIGETPRPSIVMTPTELKNDWNLNITFPTGEGISKLTSVVDGQTMDDQLFAICDSAPCSIRLHVNVPGHVRAYTFVTGIFEPSNVITVTPVK